MSLTVDTNEVLAGAVLDHAAPPPPGSSATPRMRVAERVISGTFALALSVMIERGAGFLANILSARMGGAATFGAYSLAISTANQISTYAAGGIGATAARFSGKYSHGSPTYPLLARALLTVSLFSATVAIVALWCGAGPIATLLGRHELTPLLRAASLSAAGIILMECARGFFVGQRKLAALLLLATLVGLSLMGLLPVAARHHDPVRMVLIQGSITTAAVVTCLLLAKPLGLTAQVTTAPASKNFRAVLYEVSTFGMVQLAGLVGSNIAGWWLITLIARTDKSLVQMSFFAIASQLRNLAGIAPGLLTEGSYAVMADPQGEATRTPHRVMELCTFASLAVSMAVAAVGIVFVPWGVTLLYGAAYTQAGLAVAIGLAIAVVHMGNAPASARLTIVSLRTTGIINTVWAVVVACCATAFLFFGGGAAEAMMIYFAAHALSAGLVLLALRRRDGLPLRMIALYAITTATCILLIVFATLRARHTQQTLPLTAAMIAVALLCSVLLVQMASRFRWIPHAEVLRTLRERLESYTDRGRSAHV